jgi:chromosome segregation ATPase
MRQNRRSRHVLASIFFSRLTSRPQLLVQLQNKDHTITILTGENDNLISSLSTAEARLNDLYADQARMEEEMAARIEVAEKLRAQVRELEKEKRDLQRRYNEQVPHHLPPR